MAQTNGQYGVAMFDISDDDARASVWSDLAGKVIRATNSCMIFDFSIIEQVREVLSKRASGPKDKVFKPKRFDNAEGIQDWVRVAIDTFHEEVIARFKATVDRAEKELKSGKLGVLDLSDRANDSIKRIEKKIEDFHMAAAMFRMGDEFNEAVVAIRAALDIEQTRVAVILMNNQDKLAKEVADRKKDSEAA